ncbi:hypothetical protein FS837_001555 [Tulasnella sp. UAMH 9824]|nr:hypothetical protein FS837_001555 [Tulasnella sp. UAMH 9824]
MQLNSVRNDLVEVLKYLRYRHDDRKTVWRILIDFDLRYKDRNGKTKLLRRINPTKDAILHALEEAGRTGRSGLVYFGGHGEYGPRGTSVLTPSGGRTQYSVTVNAQADSQINSSFLLAIDGGRIYGENILSRLPEEVSGECIHMVALDACHSAGIANAARNLLHVYDGKKIENGEPLEQQTDVAKPEQGYYIGGEGRRDGENRSRA